MLVDNIATETFTSPDRVRDVMHNFNVDGFEALYPKYRGGRPKTFTLLERREIKKIAGLRILLREGGVTFQRVKTWKTSKDPDYEAKKARVEHLYAIADGEVIPEPGEPEVILCMDEGKDPGREPRPRRRATYTRPHGVRHLFAAYDLGKDQLYGHIKKTKRTAASSWNSAATCARCARRTYASRSSVTTTRRT
jgi:hypothetical protein